MNKYKTKLKYVESIQYLQEDNIASAMDFCPNLKFAPEANEYYVTTPQGAYLLRYGSYIVKDHNRNFSVYDSDKFHKTFEKVEEEEMESKMLREVRRDCIEKFSQELMNSIREENNHIKREIRQSGVDSDRSKFLLARLDGRVAVLIQVERAVSNFLIQEE